MNNYIIREWEASYYCWDDRTWKYGKLAICLNSISFVEKSANGEPIQPNISLDLRLVKGFQRKLVSLLYKAVVVIVEGEKPQWFSSLQNREETFYFLEHFWQQRLLLGLGYSRRENNQRKTATVLTVDGKERRRKLFEVLYDSESTLSNAADSLYNQGEQVDHASCTMNTMHKDLNVAETILNGLDRWFTKWDIKPENFYEIDLKKEFPILYRKHLKESFCPATLVMTPDHFTILDAKRVAVVTMLLKELTSIVVRTPWNIAIVKSVIGEPDQIVDISAAHVVYIIKALQLGHGDKFEYEESSAQTHRVINHSTGNSAVSSPFTSEGDAAVEPLRPEIQVQHHQQRMSGLDEADLENVCGVVSNMKSLAVGIGQEVDRQLDRLDQLSESVDKANHRIEKDSRKLRDKL